jgi:hypothetical protein
VLDRFDCPSPQVLGEYHLDRLAAEECIGIARHLLDCHYCAAELEVLRDYLATEPAWSPDLVGRSVGWSPASWLHWAGSLSGWWPAHRGHGGRGGGRRATGLRNGRSGPV